MDTYRDILSTQDSSLDVFQRMNPNESQYLINALYYQQNCLTETNAPIIRSNVGLGGGG